MEDKMKIGELAQKANVTPRTIRYYESLGLLPPSEREGSGFHYYGSEALARLKKIEHLKNLNFSLEEIGSVIEVYFSESSNYQGKVKILEILQVHLKEVDEKIGDMQNFRNELTVQIAKMQKVVEDARNS